MEAHLPNCVEVRLGATAEVEQARDMPGPERGRPRDMGKMKEVSYTTHPRPAGVWLPAHLPVPSRTWASGAHPCGLH